MQYKPFVFMSIFVYSFFSINNIFAISNQQLVVKENKDPKAVFSYWTAEHLQNAKPIDLPKADLHLVKQILVSQFPQQQHSISQEGVPPSVHITPDSTLLFDPSTTSSTSVDNSNSLQASLNDYGSLGAQFSSSQLVPLAANLTYPYSAVGKLYFTIPNKGDYVCSASVIGPRVILTAGHCVHSGSGGETGYYTNWLFIPAYSLGNAPYKTWGYSFVVTTSSWMNGGGAVPNLADYAMLELQDQTINNVLTPVGSLTGRLGYATNRVLPLMPNHAHILGYPCNFDRCSIMHVTTAQSFRAVSPSNVEYGSDSGGGGSGGAWG